jgi:hypothetical protein
MAYWVHSKVKEKMKCCEYGPRTFYLAFGVRLLFFPFSLVSADELTMKLLTLAYLVAFNGCTTNS